MHIGLGLTMQNLDGQTTDTEVLPELHRHDVGGDIGVSHGARLQEAPSGV
jgi:hypothetical protein